jgi:hypothetical protein
MIVKRWVKQFILLIYGLNNDGCCPADEGGDSERRGICIV